MEWEDTPEGKSIRLYLQLSRQERQDRFKRTAEVAGIAHLSPRTIRGWFDEDKITGFYIGDLLLIDVPSVERYLHVCNRARV